MEKRYQVFVSSTYADLREEREHVIRALLELGCIPAGMELFPAADEDAWTLIRRVIDDSDYYVVLSAGRYGSVHEQTGVGYTEMEYQYALERGKPIIAFLHGDQPSIPQSKCETEPEIRKKLDAFRALMKKKLCKTWTTPAELGSVVSRSLIQQIQRSPAAGWVRADQLPSEDAKSEIISLRRKVEALQSELLEARLRPPPGTENLAQGGEQFQVRYTLNIYGQDPLLEHEVRQAAVELSWNQIFGVLSPTMINEAGEGPLKLELAELIRRRVEPILTRDSPNLRIGTIEINADDFATVKVQLRALGLITQGTKQRSLKDVATYWKLTPYGDELMIRLRALRSLPAEV